MTRFPGWQAKARADRSTIPALIEESLRFLTPFAAVGRATTGEVAPGGEKVAADQLLMVWIAAANRDPRQFTRPNVFDPSRDPNPHLGFGRGIHVCLGAPLARLEGRIAQHILLDRLGRLRTDPDDPAAFIPTRGIRFIPAAGEQLVGGTGRTGSAEAMVGLGDERPWLPAGQTTNVARYQRVPWCPSSRWSASKARVAWSFRPLTRSGPQSPAST